MIVLLTTFLMDGVTRHVFSIGNSFTEADVYAHMEAGKQAINVSSVKQERQASFETSGELAGFIDTCGKYGFSQHELLSFIQRKETGAKINSPEKIYLIIDSEDGEIFVEGTEEELKNWWWNKLKGTKHIDGYQFIDKDKYAIEFPDGQI